MKLGVEIGPLGGPIARDGAVHRVDQAGQRVDVLGGRALGGRARRDDLETFENREDLAHRRL